MRKAILAAVATAALISIGGIAQALPGATTAAVVAAPSSDVEQAHYGARACHLTRRGWKRDTRPYSRSCRRIHRHKCWNRKNCWYRH